MTTDHLPGLNTNAFPERSLFEKLAELVAIAALVISYALMFLSWNSVPNQVPVHFGLSGDPDQWGDKITLLIVIFVQTVIYVLMTFFAGKPSIYSLPLWISSDSRERMRASHRQMLIFLKAEVMAMLTFIIWTTIQVATGAGQALSVKYMILFVTLILGTVAWYLIRLVRAK